MKTDTELHQSVLRELEWDARVQPEHVGVAVDRGVVTLSGHVSSWAERRAVVNAAHRVEGVCDVADELEVHLHDGDRRTDADIAAAVRRALEWDALVPDRRIQSTVRNGVVTLEGDVDGWSERDDAEQAVERLSGVLAVVNEMVVVPGSVAAESVQAAVNDALARQAARESQRIKVRVEEGRVTLTGTVRSFREQAAVLGAARGTRGVRSVQHELTIDPYTLHPLP